MSLLNLWGEGDGKWVNGSAIEGLNVGGVILIPSQ